MAKIILVAKNIKNELAFIKKIREIEPDKSIFQIKDCIKNNKPFFVGEIADIQGEENIKKIKSILKFADKTKDDIVIYHISNYSGVLDEKYKITKENFYGLVSFYKEIERQSEEEDEMEALDGELENEQ
jgi:sulfite reductase alpha subunit-like flavoprotein